MNIMDKAQKRAILTIDKEYVFNDIYFGEEGMTSTSAQHVSAMANVGTGHEAAPYGAATLREEHPRDW